MPRTEVRLTVNQRSGDKYIRIIDLIEVLRTDMEDCPDEETKEYVKEFITKLKAM